jgi:hypothetical protein
VHVAGLASASRPSTAAALVAAVVGRHLVPIAVPDLRDAH